MSVPTLDYADFTSGTQEQRENFAHALLDSFEKTGFCKLKGHTFNALQLKDLFTWVRPVCTPLLSTATLTLYGRVRCSLTNR
jgi:isopenicillin N synthase-like dioxygenase